MNSEYDGELLLFSSIAGGIIGVLKSGVHLFFSVLKLAPNFYDDINTFLVHGEAEAHNLLDIIFAEGGDFVVGALFGIFLALWLKNSRSKYHWWIGVGYGVAIWFFSLVVGNVLKIIKPNETTHWGLFAHLLAMIVFGVLFVVTAKIWAPLKSRIAEKT